MRTPIFIKRLYYSVTWDQKHQERTIFLTFDDGPTPDITDEVLRILSEFNARATFFCLGRNVDRHPDIFNRIIKEGHGVGNHTYSHLKGWRTKLDQYIDDINLASKYIPSKLFRPPYGQIKRRQIRKIRDRYKIIMWDVLSLDYEQRISTERSLKMVLKNTRPGSIVVFHDSEKAWPKLKIILPQVLDYFKKNEYCFEKIED